MKVGYNRTMRRLIGFTLFLLFSFPLISPLLALIGRLRRESACLLQTELARITA